MGYLYLSFQFVETKISFKRRRFVEARAALVRRGRVIEFELRMRVRQSTSRRRRDRVRLLAFVYFRSARDVTCDDVIVCHVVAPRRDTVGESGHTRPAVR